MMGFSYSQDEGPVKCFNAPKNRQLGWYSAGDVDVALTSTPGSGWSGDIVGISDYDSITAGDPYAVNIKVDVGDAFDYYVSFNRRIGINNGTGEGANQVIVHRRTSGLGFAESDLLAKLSAGGTYSFPNGQALTVLRLAATSSTSTTYSINTTLSQVDCTRLLDLFEG